MARLLALLIALSWANPFWMGAAAAQNTARYRLDIQIIWRATTHPHEFPRSAHLSRFVAASHTARYVMFGDGRTASSGLELVAENGRPDILMAELAEAMRRRRVFKVAVAPGLRPLPARTSLIIEVDPRRSRVSFVTMIAPSPDWFTGVAGVNLRRGGKWMSRVTVPLWAWDAGTDSGATFTARNQDTQPRQSVRLLATPHFLSAKGLLAVGKVTFVKLP